MTRFATSVIAPLRLSPRERSPEFVRRRFAGATTSHRITRGCSGAENRSSRAQPVAARVCFGVPRRTRDDGIQRAIEALAKRNLPIFARASDRARSGLSLEVAFATVLSLPITQRESLRGNTRSGVSADGSHLRTSGAAPPTACVSSPSRAGIHGVRGLESPPPAAAAWCVQPRAARHCGQHRGPAAGF